MSDDRQIQPYLPQILKICLPNGLFDIPFLSLELMNAGIQIWPRLIISVGRQWLINYDQKGMVRFMQTLTIL